jgi:hypothetical protein
VLSLNNLEIFRNFSQLSLILQWKRRKLKKKAERFLLKSVINFKILETRKKKLMISKMKTVKTPRHSEMLKRKFLKRRFQKKTSIVRQKSLKAKGVV